MGGTPEVWEYDGPASQRLWQKSVIGRLLKNGSLALSPAETLFVHHHRNIELPNNDWKTDALSMNGMLLQEYCILEALRVPGNKVVLTGNLDLFDLDYQPQTWACRWPSDSHPKDSQPTAEVRWFLDSEMLSPAELHNWAVEVRNSNRIPEVMIVDEELSVVSYQLSSESPIGIFKEEGLGEKLPNLSDGINSADGMIFPSENWEIEQLGIPTEEGIFLDTIASEIVDGKSPLSQGALILLDLLDRGLVIRPGFKYGSKWRCYEKRIGDDHAPYLVVLPDEAPKNWAGACLASRLASGVNKIWLHPVNNEGSWNYLAITRPPADSRWTNPSKR